MNKKGKRKQKKPRHTKNEYSEINDWELRTNIAIAMTLTEKAKSFALDLPSHSLLRYSIEIEMFRWIEFSTSMPSFNGRYNIKWQNILRIHNSVPSRSRSRSVPLWLDSIHTGDSFWRNYNLPRKWNAIYNQLSAVKTIKHASKWARLFFRYLNNWTCTKKNHLTTVFVVEKHNFIYLS